MDIRNPPLSLLCKLGSIAIHAEELTGPFGHAFDKVALKQLLDDPEVREWRGAMGASALLPLKRTAEDMRQTARKKVRRRKGEDS